MKLPPSYKPGSADAVVLFDAFQYLHRAYHALPPLKNKQGQSLGAVFGFLRTVIKIFKTLEPKLFVICWDSKPTGRLELDENYKANRPETPDDLRSQIDLTREMIGHWGLPLIEVDGAEADDVMATIASAADARGWMSYLFSSDKDVLQLVNERIVVYQEAKDSWMDVEAVKKKYGINPGQLVDYFSLIGDAVDNISGVAGVGPVTAAKLLQKYQNIKGIVDALEKNSGDLSPKVIQALSQSKDKIIKNQALVSLDRNVAIDLSWEKFVLDPKPNAVLDQHLIKLGFSSIREDLNKMGWIQVFSAETNQGSGDSKLTPGSSSSIGERSSQWPLNGMILEEAANSNESLGVILGADNKTKIVHGLKDFLKRHAISEDSLLEGPIWDTRLMAWVNNPAEELLDLEALCLRFGVQSIGDLALKLRQALHDQGLWELYEKIELPLAKVLWRMECEGIKVDEAHLVELGRSWEIETRRLKERFIETSGAAADINLNSPKQLSQLFFEQLKLPVIKKTKTGYSTDEEVLQKLKSRHESIAYLLEFREIFKLRSTFVEGLLHAINPKTRRIHATFDQEGTETGRVSCRYPNLQNIPVRSEHGLAIREAFVAGQDGWELVSLDYSQIDLRVFAHLSQDPALIEFFRLGRDIHEETARAVLGSDGKEVSLEDRRHAKAVTFGILYGMGSYGLAQDLGISDEDARLIIETYYQRFPGVWHWRQKTIEQAQKDGYVTTILGRRRPLPMLASERRSDRGHAERAAINTPVQGSSADIIKIAMIHLDDYIRSCGASVRMMVQVHDEILLEGPSAQLSKHLPQLVRVMSEAMKLEVPLVVNAKRGPNWRNLVPVI